MNDIEKEFNAKFVIPDTCEEDIMFWEGTTPKEVKEFIKVNYLPKSEVRQAIDDIVEDRIDLICLLKILNLEEK